MRNLRVELQFFMYVRIRILVTNGWDDIFLQNDNALDVFP